MLYTVRVPRPRIVVVTVGRPRMNETSTTFRGSTKYFHRQFDSEWIDKEHSKIKLDIRLKL